MRHHASCLLGLSLPLALAMTLAGGTPALAEEVVAATPTDGMAAQAPTSGTEVQTARKPSDDHRATDKGLPKRAVASKVEKSAVRHDEGQGLGTDQAGTAGQTGKSETVAKESGPAGLSRDQGRHRRGRHR